MIMNFEVIDEENEIGYKVDHESVCAYSLRSRNPKEIGSLDTVDGFLNYINVDEKFQKQGIGTRLIKLAVEYSLITHVSCMMECDCYEYSLSSAGEQLIASCVEQGIISKRMCVFPGQKEYGDVYNGENIDDDPRYISIVVQNAILRRQQMEQQEAEALSKQYTIKISTSAPYVVRGPLLTCPPSSPLPPYFEESESTEYNEQDIQEPDSESTPSLETESINYDPENKLAGYVTERPAKKPKISH